MRGGCARGGGEKNEEERKGGGRCEMGEVRSLKDGAWKDERGKKGGRGGGGWREGGDEREGGGREEGGEREGRGERDGGGERGVGHGCMTLERCRWCEGEEPKTGFKTLQSQQSSQL